MSDIVIEYVRKGRSVLEANWRGRYTVPAAGLYPHQWNWDSAFIAIGYSRYDTAKAILELKSLFEAQWQNGMLPQIVFDPRMLGRYFPEPDFWQTERSPNAPKMLTSGITMPPLHAFAALKIYVNAGDKDEVIPFLKWLYPRLLALHRYLYRERDPERVGLVCIRHPWESGMDNSPMWDKVLNKVDLDKADIPQYRRLDLSAGINASERPKNKDYDRFVYLVDLFRRLRYDEKEILKACPFQIYGPLFNAILSASNEAMTEIARIIGEDSREPAEWFETTRRGISEKLYNDDHGMFDYYDIVAKKRLEAETAAGFIPLFGKAASQTQASRLYEYLNSQSFCALHQGNCYTLPNYDTCKEDFERANYWRGPIWININWMIMLGLQRYGYRQKADSIAKDILQLPMRFGFREYYDSFDGRGYGSDNFSWTAALFIDTAYENYLRQGKRPGRRILWKKIDLNRKGDAVNRADKEISRKMLQSIKAIRSGFCSECGTVNYETIKRSREYRDYRNISSRLQYLDLESLNVEEEKLAFWINLYNAIVIDGIINTGIDRSVKEVWGFFRKVGYLIGGYRFSSDDIEHGILRGNARPPMRLLRQFGLMDRRKRFIVRKRDPRIHFALVCGSRSCAPIKFYTAKGIDRELDIAAKNFVNSSEVIVMPEEGRLLISMIFKWYKGDFGGHEGVLTFIRKYLVDDDKREYLERSGSEVKIAYLYYDWNLNRAA